MRVRESDLSSPARIRNAALELFARRGVAATSHREVAAAAGVSPGRVQHHFATKAALRAAVDEYVVSIATEAFVGLEEVPPRDLLEEIGARITQVVRDHPLALVHVTRSVSEGDEAGLRTFDAFVAVADDVWQRLADAGLVRPDLDRRWAALHSILLPLASVLLAPGIARHLPRDFLRGQELERWNQATLDLFRHGALRTRARRTRS